jgi:hypothetical protein
VVRYLKPNERIELSYQDDGQTLKVFLVEEESYIKKLIAEYQESYRSAMEIKDWVSCDYYDKKINSLKVCLGLKSPQHPLDKV